MTAAEERAYQFIHQETEFHLGLLTTEQSHPKTRTFSQTIQKDTMAGMRQLLSVDQDIPPVAERIFRSSTYEKLKRAIQSTAAGGGRICFSGCGSTGRLSIILETLWRRFWKKAAEDFPGEREHFLERADQSYSIMTGGDRALIKSVEGFEDYQQFGRRQVQDAGIGRDDLLIAITEGGETSSVIGTAWQALENSAQVFFLFNNPVDILKQRIRRSREIIECSEITKLDLTTGPMALSGSTRMQATTMEMLVAGAALEQAAVELLQEDGLPTGLLKEKGYSTSESVCHAKQFGGMIDRIMEEDSLRALSRLVELEEDVYRNHSLVTYVANEYLLDIFSDTTERTPTFMIPAFRQAGDTVSPPSWAFAKNPLKSSRETWKDMLQREPRGLNWEVEDYRQMKAPEWLCGSPPALDTEEIYRFQIGKKEDPSRYQTPDSALILVYVADSRSEKTRELLVQAYIRAAPHYKRALCFVIGDRIALQRRQDRLLIPLQLKQTPMFLFFHLAAKIIFNAVSTATMGRMGRITNNWMIQLATSNKKLIDRSTRIISEIAGISYYEACLELFKTMEEFRKGEVPATTSHLVVTLERLKRLSNLSVRF